MLNKNIYSELEVGKNVNLSESWFKRSFSKNSIVLKSRQNVDRIMESDIADILIVIPN